MVCLGNICRSPLAEGLLRSKLDGDKFVVDSAGTANYHIGKAPDERSVAVAKKYGLDISHLKARQFKVSDFNVFDVIYVMDNSNYENVKALARDEKELAKVKFILNEVYPNQNQAVPDPYYGGDDGFEQTYNMLNKACAVVAEKLKS